LGELLPISFLLIRPARSRVAGLDRAKRRAARSRAGGGGRVEARRRGAEPPAGGARRGGDPLAAGGRARGRWRRAEPPARPRGGEAGREEIRRWVGRAERKVARRRAAGGAARREGGGWRRIWGGDLEGGGRAEGRRDAKSSGSCSDGAFPLVV